MNKYEVLFVAFHKKKRKIIYRMEFVALDELTALAQAKESLYYKTRRETWLNDTQHRIEITWKGKKNGPK